LTIEVQPLLASAQVATSLCVLTQEFVVNSFKHAFDEEDCGHVNVRLSKTGEAGAELVVEDDGSGLPETVKPVTVGIDERSGNGPPDHPAEGLGTKIAALLTRQFAGNIAYEETCPGAARPGTRVIIRLTDLVLSYPEDADATPAVKNDKTTSST